MAIRQHINRLTSSPVQFQVHLVTTDIAAEFITWKLRLEMNFTELSIRTVRLQRLFALPVPNITAESFVNRRV